MWAEDQFVFQYLYRIGDYSGWIRAKTEITSWMPDYLISVIYQSLLKIRPPTLNQEMIILLELQEYAKDSSVARRIAYRASLGVLRVYLEQIYCDLPERIRTGSLMIGMHHQSQLAELIKTDVPEMLFYLWECCPVPGFTYDDHQRTIQLCSEYGSLRILGSIYHHVLRDQPTKQQELIDTAYTSKPKKSKELLAWLLDHTSCEQLERHVDVIVRFRYPALILEYLQRMRPILSIQAWVAMIRSRKISHELGLFLKDVIPNAGVRCAIYGAELYWECFLVSYSDLAPYLTNKWQIQEVQSRYVAFRGTAFLDRAMEEIDHSLL